MAGNSGPLWLCQWVLCTRRHSVQTTAQLVIGGGQLGAAFSNVICRAAIQTWPRGSFHRWLTGARRTQTGGLGLSPPRYSPTIFGRMPATAMQVTPLPTAFAADSSPLVLLRLVHSPPAFCSRGGGLRSITIRHSTNTPHQPWYLNTQ